MDILKMTETSPAIDDLKFRDAVATVLKHEGGLVDDKDDSGGITNYGISLRFLKNVGDDLNQDGMVNHVDIRDMSRSQAIQLYYDQFWLKYRYDRLPQRLAAKVFDMAINMGPRQAHRLLQRTLNKLGARLVVDGIMGPATRSAIDDFKTAWIMPELIVAQADFYRMLVESKPVRGKWLRGWLNRAYSG
jgi:lysozyme family protein